MADTARTVPTLLTTLFQDGQAPASINPQDMRDLIVSFDSKSFKSVVEYGADPTGNVDSTAAFQNAMAAGVAYVPACVPGTNTQATYLLNNCVVPNGGQLIGFNSLNFNVPTAGRPLLRALTSGTVRLLNVDSKNAITIQGLVLDLFFRAGTTCDGISAGCTNLTLRDVSVLGARFGVGGAVAGSTATFPTGTWIGQFWNCIMFNCITGVGDMIDVTMVGGNLAACTTGVALTAASGACSIIGTRIEENTNYGITIANGCNDISITGSMFDQNGNAAALVSGSWVNFSNCIFRRNGYKVSAGTTLIANSCHLEFNGAAHVMVTGCLTHDEQTDSGHNSVFCPAAVAHFDGAAGNNTAIMFVGNDLSGYQGSTAGGVNAAPHSSNTTWFTGTAPTGTGINAFVVKNNIGTGTAAQDVDLR